MLGFILSLFGILFLLAIAFFVGMIVMVYLLTELIAKKDMLTLKINKYRDLVNNASNLIMNVI